MLLEIALKVGNSLDLNEMLHDSISTMMRLLNCSGAQVIRSIPNNDDSTLLWKPILSIPRPILHSSEIKAFLESIHLPKKASQLNNWSEKLPTSKQNGIKTRYLFNLQGFGALLLEKNGEPFEPKFTYSFQPILNKLGHAALACIASIERHESINSLALSEELNRSLLSTIPDIVIRTDLEGNITFINESTLRGYPFVIADELLGKNLMSFIAPKDIQRAMDNTQLMSEKPFGLQQYSIIINGNTIECEVNGVTVLDTNNNPTGRVYVIRDITERHRTEALLRESEEKYRSILVASPDGIVISDLDGNILMVSPRALKLMGYNSQEEVLSLKLFDFIIPNDRERAVSNVSLMFQGMFTGAAEYHLIGSAGTELPFEINAEFIRNSAGKPEKLIFIIRDISERKTAELKIRNTDAQFKALFLEAADAIFIAEIESGILLEANSSASRLMQMPRSKIIGLHQTELHPKQNLVYTTNTFEKHIKETFGFDKFIPLEDQIIRPDGTLVPVEILASQIQYNGKDCIMGIFRDITDRKQAENALRESNQFVNALLRAIPVAVFFKDKEGRYLGCNNVFTDLTGFTADELKGKTVYEIWPSELSLIYHKKDLELLTERNHQVYESSVRDKDGNNRSVIFAKDVFFDVSGNPAGIVGAYLDITERKQAEQKLRQSEEFLNESQRIANMGSWEFDLINNKVYWSENTFALYGLKPGDIEPSFDFFRNAVHPDDLEIIDRTKEDIQHTDNAITTEYRVLLKDGTTRWLQNTMLAEKLNGLAIKLKGTEIDITVRKQAELELENLKRKDQEALRVAKMGHWEFDMLTGQFLFNDQYYSLHGITAEEAGGYTISAQEFAQKYVHPDDAHSVAEAIQKGISATDPSYEFKQQGRILRADGEARYVIIWFRTEKDSNGRTVRLYGVNQDITELKRTETALRFNEERLEVLLALNNMANADERELTNFAMEAAVSLTSSSIGYIAFMNQDETVLTMYAWSSQAMHECSIVDKPIVYPVDSTGLWGEAVRQRKVVITNDYAAPNPWKKGTPDGHVQITRHMNAPIFEEERIVLVAGVGNKSTNYEDDDVRQLSLLMSGLWSIIHRKRAEEKLRQQKEQLTEVSDMLPSVIYQFFAREDGSKGVYYISRRATDVFGYPDGTEDFFEWFTRRVDDRDRADFLASIENVVREHAPWNFEGRFIKPSGELIWFHGRSRPVRRGSELIFNGVLSDITERKQKEIQLRNLSQAVEQSPASVIITNTHGNIEYVNQKFTEVSGYAIDEVIGQNPRILKSGNQETDYYKELWETISTGKDWHGEFQNKKKNGELYWETASISPIMDNTGKITHYIALKEDITKRKELEENLKKQSSLRELLMEIAAGFINIPAQIVDNVIVEALGKMGNFVNADRVYTFDYDWGKRIAINTYEWCAEGINPEIENLQAVPIVMFQDWIDAHTNGRYIHIANVSDLQSEGAREILESQGIKSLITVPMLNEGFCIGFVGFDSVRQHHHYSDEEKELLKVFAQSLADVKLKRSMLEQIIASKERAEQGEEELQKMYFELQASEKETLEANEELNATSDTLKETNRLLQQALGKAQESDKLKTAFLHNMSHEIRTPLNAIQGFSGLLSTPNLSGEERNYYVNIIQNSGNQLLTIISDILTISSIDTGQEKIRNTNVCIDNLISEMEAIFSQQVLGKPLTVKGIKPQNSEVTEILTDKTKLIQILSNLLSNAIKFTSKGKIIFGCTVNGNFLEFYVKDNGIGIDKSNHLLIFERFVQANDNIRYQYGGTGLGLSICKGYVELLGGVIWVDSEPGKGSTFCFSIPLVPDKSSKPSVSDTIFSISHSKDFKILVAEDDQNSFILLRELLKVHNIKVIHARNGKEAVDICKNNTEVSMVLMDIKMPIMDGIAATRLIKECRPNLPVIAQSAYVAKQDIENTKNLFDDYITKPISSHRLKDVLGRFIHE